MTQIQLRAPDGVSEFTLRGIPMKVEGGLVTVSKEYLEELRAFGFQHADPSVEAASRRGSRVALVNRVIDDLKEALGNLSDGQLIEYDRAREGLAFFERNKAWADILTHFGYNALQQVQAAAEPARQKTFDEMSRSELFAYLKAHGIAALPSHSNDDLRIFARGQAGD